MEKRQQQLDSDERNMAMLCHLSSFAGSIVPMGHIIGPLAVWLSQKEKSKFVDIHGKEALNFQISVTIYGIICCILVLAIIGIFLLIALGIFALVVVIVAAVKANNGEYYRYPLCLRFIK